VKPVDFAYVQPRTVEEAVACLGAEDAKALAGGQSLVPMLNMRLARPATLVDLNALPGLAGIERESDGSLALGALVRHTDLARTPLAGAHALLAEAARHIGHRAIRNRGTLGGSLAHADPAAELPAAVVALDARLVVAGPRGTREVAAGEFFVGMLATALEPQEILTTVRIPAAPGATWGFAELARRTGDYALAGVAAVLRAPGGRCETARLVAFGAADRPLRLAAAEARLTGTRVDAAGARAAGAAAAAACAPPDDVHATAEYRRHLVAVLTEQVVLEALARQERITP
jgi:aerobic carbon-monoxide dehydrogenase medium subunit